MTRDERRIPTKDMDIDVFIETLLSFLHSEEIVLIYTDVNNTEKFSAGYVKALSEQEVLIAHTTPYGKYDGYIVKRLKDIYRIEHGGQYSEKIKKLYSTSKTTHEDISSEKESLFFVLLNFACKHKKIVSIELLESDSDDVIGYVESLDGGVVTVKLIDRYGMFDGITLIYISDITHLVCDSEDENALNTLISIK